MMDIHMARSMTMPVRKKATMTHDTTKDVTMSFRLPAAERERLTALAALMGERAGGIPLPESYALRAALKRGLDELEAELGGKAKR
jgi:predicted DNA-binding protein